MCRRCYLSQVFQLRAVSISVLKRDAASKLLSDLLRRRIWVRIILWLPRATNRLLIYYVFKSRATSSSNFWQVAWGKSADNFRGMFVNWCEIMKIMCTHPNDRVVSLMIFGSRNSDTRHGSNDGILFYDLTKWFLERVQVHTSSLLHDLTDTMLAHLEGLQSLVLRAEFFSAHAHTATPEIDLSHRVLSFWILRWVNLTENLKVRQSVAFIFRTLWIPASRTIIHSIGFAIVAKRSPFKVISGPHRFVSKRSPRLC